MKRILKVVLGMLCGLLAILLALLIALWLYTRRLLQKIVRSGRFSGLIPFA